MKRLLFSCLLVVPLLLSTSLLLVPSTASAQALLESLNCQGETTKTFNPPLTNTPQQVTDTDNEALGSEAPNVGACVVVGASITGGTRYSVHTKINSCTELLNSAPHEFIYNWNTGDTSTVDFTIQSKSKVNGETVITREGTVTDGFGKDDHAVGTETLLNTALDACSTTGITALSGPTTLTFTI